MKKIKLFLAIIMCLFAMPLAVLADESSNDNNVEVTSGETEVKRKTIELKFISSVEMVAHIVRMLKNFLIVLKKNMANIIKY